MSKDNTDKPMARGMRDTLKALVQSEIEKLPEQLDKLPASERVSVLCKLMPYVFPKIEAVHVTDGEPFVADW